MHILHEVEAREKKEDEEEATILKVLLMCF